MGTSLKRMVRDRLVNDATFRGLFTGVSTTATAPVAPVFMERTGTYPQVIYSEMPGATDPGMSATNGLITFMVQTQATGGVNPHAQAEVISERIDQLFDDQSMSGVGISGTAAYSFLFLRQGGTELTYNKDRKDYSRFTVFSYKMIKY